MLPITQKSAETLIKLIDRLNENVRSRKISNSSSFMPVSVEFLNSIKEGDLISVCHYFEQNGDLMRDPEVVFLRTEQLNTFNGKSVPYFFPTTFQQDNLGIYQELVTFDDEGNFSGLALSQQTQCAKFCNTWMENIRMQQQL